ncbi:MAG: trp operon repressor [Candidatus Pacebacteria bacterium]|nr:trp operon repressor [Candidatus Paceibacterota bacterium]
MNHPNLRKKLIKAFEQTQKKTSDVNFLINALLTSSEINDIALRLEILRRLSAGETHRSIAESLGVGIATVTRGSRQLQQSGGTLEKFFKNKNHE